MSAVEYGHSPFAVLGCPDCAVPACCMNASTATATARAEAKRTRILDIVHSFAARILPQSAGRDGVAKLGDGRDTVLVLAAGIGGNDVGGSRHQPDFVSLHAAGGVARRLAWSTEGRPVVKER